VSRRVSGEEVSVHAIDPVTSELTYQRQGIINVPGPICVLFVE
jgi:hypothetical protein